MCALSSSPLKNGLFVEWSVESDVPGSRFGLRSESETFRFQNRPYRLRFNYDSDDGDCTLGLTLVDEAFVSTVPFVVTVLVEEKAGSQPKCQSLACERVSEMPWECELDENFLFRNYERCFRKNEKTWTRLCFVIIFVEDPTSVRNDNIERSIETELAQATTKGWKFPSNLENLSLDFANLLKNETLSDVRLKCGGRDGAIPAHRSVLAARSEVFAAMFRSEMAESRSGEVDVPDVDGDVLDPFLQYVYSGRIPSGVSDEVVPGLYAAADKYAVHALREACRQRMVGCLTEENCVEILTVADAHGDGDFKKSVIDFICDHGTVFKGKAWREFAKKPSLLAMEVYQSKVERET